VSVTLAGQDVTVKGPKGQLSIQLVEDIEATQDDAGVTVRPRNETKRARMMWGMSRTLVSNMVKGVSEGFQTDLEITGVGYRAAVQGKNLQLQLGYSHDVLYPIPDGITIKCDKPTSISVSGIDAQQVGQVAAEIRAWRPPEPYKGKGVKYAKEFIFRKEGKKK
jgi:large subunit ribosomal protein L6